MTIKRATNWAGDYSRFSFDESKRYVAMLKEQGRAVLDDEFNVLQDMLLTFTRRVALDVAGTAASPNSGFRIVGTGAANNFVITGGDGTVDGAGVLYVGGLRLILPSNTTYAAQESPGPALSPPVTGSRVDVVYCDVWLDEVGPSADPAIVDPTFGTETSRRLGLMYAVRVAPGGPAPANYVDANGRDHYIGALATINRTSSAIINPSDVTDTRAAFSIPAALIKHNLDANAHREATESLKGFTRFASIAEGRDGSSTGTAVTPAVLAAVLSDRVQPGDMVVVPHQASRAGALLCNGAAVSRTVYARLFAKIGTTHGSGDGATTFNVPDMRGYFVRGFDGGSGIDAGRAFASSQDDQMPEHLHFVATPTQANNVPLTNSNVMVALDDAGGDRDYELSGANTTASIGRSSTVGTGNEVRVKNKAYHYYIIF